MKNKFAKRVREIKVSAIKQMPLLARRFSNVVSLGQGIPSLPTPKYIREQVIEALNNDNNGIGKYSLQPGMTELKQAAARIVEKKSLRQVDAEKEIFISAGAMEALFTAIVSIVDNGDEVILFDPSYASHIEQVIFAGGVPVYVPLEKGWNISIEKLSKAITAKTKAIIVCSPNNPTGKVFAESDLKAIVELAAKNDLFVIADETYDFLVYDNLKFKSLTSISKDNLIACFSFSKEYAMTGWRLGYMYAPAEVIEQCLKVHDATVIAAPTISQFAGLAALSEQNSSEVAEIKTALESRRNLMCLRLDLLSDLFEYEKPMGAYYILVKYLKTKLTSEQFAFKLLEDVQVITIPGNAFGPSGEGYIRMSFGGTEPEINEAFDRIEAWNKNLK
jgi:aminotransferase